MNHFPSKCDLQMWLSGSFVVEGVRVLCAGPSAELMHRGPVYIPTLFPPRQPHPPAKDLIPISGADSTSPEAMNHPR